MLNLQLNREFEDVSEKILFGRIKTKDDFEKYISEKGYEYRKNKTFTDVQSAIKKGLKEGSGKVENEINWVAFYIKQIVKPIRITTAVAVQSLSKDLIEKEDTSINEVDKLLVEYKLTLKPNKSLESLSKALDKVLLEAQNINDKEAQIELYTKALTKYLKLL